eukprot:gene13759-40560_t
MGGDVRVSLLVLDDDPRCGMVLARDMTLRSCTAGTAAGESERLRGCVGMALAEANDAPEDDLVRAAKGCLRVSLRFTPPPTGQRYDAARMGETTAPVTPNGTGARSPSLSTKSELHKLREGIQRK